MINTLREHLERIDAELIGVGYNNSLYIKLPNQVILTAIPIIGVPNIKTLELADKITVIKPFAIIYDHIGMDKEYQEHIDWLDLNFNAAKWIKLEEAAWVFPEWE